MQEEKGIRERTCLTGVIGVVIFKILFLLLLETYLEPSGHCSGFSKKLPRDHLSSSVDSTVKPFSIDFVLITILCTEHCYDSG